MKKIGGAVIEKSIIIDFEKFDFRNFRNFAIIDLLDKDYNVNFFFSVD